MKIKDVIPENQWDKITLKDYNTKKTGGVSFAGETLGHFIATCELTADDEYAKLVSAMTECDVIVDNFGEFSLGR